MRIALHWEQTEDDQDVMTIPVHLSNSLVDNKMLLYSGTFTQQTPVGPMLMSVVECCPLYGSAIFYHAGFWDEKNCPLFGGVRCLEVVSVNGGSTAFCFSIAIGTHRNGTGVGGLETYDDESLVSLG